MGDMLSEGATSDKKLKIIEMKKSEPSPPVVAQKSEEPMMNARKADNQANKRSTEVNNLR